MKTIKYLVVFLCAALIAGACTKDNGLSQQNKGKDKPTVGIIKGSSNDGVIKFEIIASEDAAQYAYAVLAGSGNQAPEAMSILTAEVPGAEAGESFNTKGTLGSSGSANITLDCSTFMKVANEYEIFAVAITEDGLVGEITSVLIVMNDTIAPEPVGASPDNNMIQIVYPEEIVLGKGKATVQYYKYIIGELTDAVSVPSANITVSGNVATIICPKPADGSVYYFLSLEAGVFEDLAGNKQPVLKSGIDRQGQAYGILWMSAPVSFNIGNNLFSAPAADWSAEGAAITFTFPFNVYESGLRDGVRVAYRDDWGSKEVITPYTLGSDKRTVTVTLPEKPLGTFDLIIEEGLFYDEWGNTNAARVPGEDYLYENYWLTVKPGDYLVGYNSDENTESQFPALIELMSRDIVVLNADWFNIFGGYALPTNLIGFVDYKNRTISFDGTWIYNGQIQDYICFGLDTYYWDQAKSQLMVFWGSGQSGQDPIVMTFDEQGYITSTSSFDYSLYNASTSAYIGVIAYTADATDVTYVSAAGAKQQSFNTVASDRYVKATFSNNGFVKER